MRRIRVVVLSILALLLVVALAACNSSTPMGSLKVTVNGLPSGAAGKVLVAGPSGYSQTVTSTTTLSVAVGTYSVTVGAASNGNTIVPTMYDGSASPASVSVAANSTSSTTVTYAVRPGSGHMWVPMFGGALEAESFSSGSLTTSGSPSPDVTIADTKNSAESVAFDGSGNMWVADDTGYVYGYNAGDLAASGTPTPVVTIDATAYGSLMGLAFDASGDLWAADKGSSQLLMYSPGQLSSGGALTPQVVLSATSTTPASISGPFGIAFDDQGDLWVANNGTDAVVEFTPAQLSATGSPTPTVSLSSSSVSAPFGIAFDASGNLWVGTDNGKVVRFDANQLATSGTLTPAATLTSSAVGTNPDGVTFDASGALWVGDWNGGAAAVVRRFTNPDALTGSVTPTPDVILSSIGSTDFPQVAFSPPPANVPLQTP